MVVAGLALGYWVVTYLINDLNRDKKNPLGTSATPREPVGAAGDAVQPWHEVLKIPPDATSEEIRRSYRLLMQQYRPDKVAALGEELKVVAERKSGEIDAAYRRALLARGELP